LKGLQKLVKGIHGRQAATGISDFKNWTALEERASLLWSNAHFYNEEGSAIHTLATELKVRCHRTESEAARLTINYLEMFRRGAQRGQGCGPGTAATENQAEDDSWSRDPGSSIQEDYHPRRRVERQHDCFARAPDRPVE
jgi:hypothetical protein